MAEWFKALVCQIKPDYTYLGYNPILEYSQVVRHSFLVRAFIGSNPLTPIIHKSIHAKVVKLVDTLGLGSSIYYVGVQVPSLAKILL